MLKLPKGLKKKKKGKKSKKDQELFTEEELEQYKREQRAKQEAALEAAKSDAGESDATSDVEGGESGAAAPAPGTVDSSATAAAGSGETAPTNGAVKNDDDEEWAKFKALTSGVDSILSKTQKELDHIKQTSFYQRVPSAAEKKKLEEEEAAAREAARLEEERRKEEEKEANRDKLAEAVVELSESEEESEEVDDIFATDYIDAITSGEIQLAVVPDSPVLEIDEGPDPFDTAYAEKVIVGADKAKGGKKLVSLGAAVEVLTGRVDRDHAVALSGAKRKPRKGIQNLLLDDSIDLEAVASEVEAVSATPEPVNLLDELADDIPSDVPIDLSASLHLQFIQKPKVDEDEEGLENGVLPEREEAEGAEDQPPADVVAEFDVLNDDEDDEFAELAAESLTKKEEVKVITQVPVPTAVAVPIEGNWAEFEPTPVEDAQPVSGQKVKPPRPPGPPPRPTVGPHIAPGVVHLSDEDEFALDDDPFDTTFAETVVAPKEAADDDDDDFDFDPRAEERKAAPPAVPPQPQKPLQRDLLGGSNTDFTEVDTSSNLLTSYQKDLLAGSTTDITAIGADPIAPVKESSEDFDPFDTSAVSVIVQPKEVELKVLEKELLQDTKLKHSLSDPDFDPRADEPPAPVLQVQPVEPFDPARRKSSLSLNLQSKTVGFLVPKDQDLLGASSDGGKVQKPLTPYYAPAESIPEKDNEDPFDTSFVPANKPSEVELKNLEQDLLASGTLKHSLSDPDFDPRAPPTPVAPADLLAVQENINTKVLTPAQESKDLVDDIEAIVDPFDTSIAANIAPGRAELKLLESELLPAQTPEITTGVLDTLTDAQELGLGDKVLTPQISLKESSVPEDIDPFDTSIAENLAPGQTEIKLLEIKMANPFLMMGDDMDEGVEAAVNPFLVQDGAMETTEDFENPFAGQTNPFAFGDDAEENPPTVPMTMADIYQTAAPTSTTNASGAFHSIDPAMSFFGTTIDADDDAIDPGSEDGGKKASPPRPSPPSQQTQDLIFSVADQLDQASSQLLGRLPATRPPSPLSMRDLHSPSPTPDSGLADLLDVSDSGSSGTQGFDMDLMGSSNENPFAAPTTVPTVQPAAPVQQPAKVLPPRPPPPRPAPPRPIPPSIPGAPPRPVPPQSPQQPQLTSEPDDLFDMFGTSAPPKPPPPKSKEDILSLFTKPSPPQPEQQDLLSGDFVLEPMPMDEQQMPASAEVPPEAVEPEPSPLIQTEPVDEQPQDEPIFTSTLTHPDDSIQDITNNPQAAVEPAVTPMSTIAPEMTARRAPTPDIEITTVEDLPRSDDEEEPEPTPAPAPPPEVNETEPEPEPQPEEAEIDKREPDQSPPTESITATQAVPESPMDANSSYQNSEPEQMDTGLDFAPPSGAASANPFASPDADEETYPQPAVVTNIFAVEEPVTNIFAVEPEPALNIFAADPEPTPTVTNIFAEPDEFDAFSAKFDSAKKDNISLLDGFGGAITPTSTGGGDAWGDADDFGATPAAAVDDGFGADEGFDSFLAMQAPERSESVESVDKEFSVVIRPKGENAQGVTPVLAPPPPPRGSQNNSMYSGDSSPRVNPFDKGDDEIAAESFPAAVTDQTAPIQRTDSQETPQTPLFDEDVSQPLEDFPRLGYSGPGWEMQLRQPNKKKITGQRFWKKIFVRMVIQNDVPVIQLFNQASDKQPFQELPLQPSYSVSEIGAQQYDQFGKIFTMKLQYIFYKERPGVRPGQVTKAERITNKLSQFAQYAIAGDYQGVKEFGSDLKKLGLPVEHAPQSSQLFKIGSMNYEDMKQFSLCIEEALFKIPAHRDRALNYKMEEVQVTAVDEIYVEQDAEGKINKQIARVRLFFLAFLSGMPTIELGMNDMWRQGKEVVGRHDIIPVVTEEWIRLEGVEFHNSVNLEEYERTRTIRFQPPDACYIELMRFRVRPPKNRELPLQLKATWCVTGNKVELRADILVPGFASRKLGQIPCEDVSIRFPIPECWIYLFRVEKHFRYGSVKSAHRRTGKIKGIERILGAVDTLQESLIEVTSGQAKYEHHHRAIVWRCPRLPKEGQGAYTTHQMVCRMALTSYDQIPSELAPYAYVEFTMPATQVSHTTVRSVSVQDSDSDEPPEKYVRYLARHEYRVGIETTHGESTNAYLAATRPIKEAPSPQPAASPMPPSDSDSDSN